MPTTTRAKPTRSKRLSNARVPQSREECGDAIALLGRRKREVAGLKSAADDRISVIQEELEADRAPLLDEIAELEQGIEAFCNVHRDQLTGGKSKTVMFATGEVKWRFRPPKVAIRGTDAVLEQIKRGGKRFGAFLRTKEEINKDAMQAAPEVAREIRGVTIKSEGEDFVIEPAELAEAS